MEKIINIQNYLKSNLSFIHNNEFIKHESGFISARVAEPTGNLSRWTPETQDSNGARDDDMMNSTDQVKKMVENFIIADRKKTGAFRSNYETVLYVQEHMKVSANLVWSVIETLEETKNNLHQKDYHEK